MNREVLGKKVINNYSEHFFGFQYFFKTNDYDSQRTPLHQLMILPLIYCYASQDFLGNS